MINFTEIHKKDQHSDFKPDYLYHDIKQHNGQTTPHKSDNGVLSLAMK